MKNSKSSPEASPTVNIDKEDSLSLRRSIGEQFAACAQKNLFTTQTPHLFPLFLDRLPSHLRQYHNCFACRQFVERYGNIVAVTPKGKTIAAMWNADLVPDIYKEAVRHLAEIVSRSPIESVFLTELRTLGTPVTGCWEHFAVNLSDSLVFKPSLIRTTEQVVAEKKQDYEVLSRGLVDFPIKVAKKARSLLASGSLYQAEKCLATAEWFVKLHEQRRSAPDSRCRDNLTWLAVADAPAGFCHVRSNAIGTLLEDIQADLSFGAIKSRFEAKMNPLQYQRPTAAPAGGNIDRAEKIIEVLKTAGSLERRFAKLSDVKALWLPRRSQQEDLGDRQGVFSHLRTSKSNDKSRLEVPKITISWEKFARTVLPAARSIEYFVPHNKQPYMALVTAKYPDAPPILQWDFEEARNPVSWYFYVEGSEAVHWNLKSGIYHPVTAIVLQPSMWDDTARFAHQGEKAFFILKGAKDMQYSRGCGFFPVFLKSEYHEVRSTLEAYAQNAIVEGQHEAEACGIGLTKGLTWHQMFRVTSEDDTIITYELDRWD